MLLDLGVLGGALDEAADAAEHGEDDEEADRQEGRELDQRLGGDRHDQAFLVLGRIDVAGAEQHGERGHRQRDDECRVDRQMRAAAAGSAPSSVSTESATALSCRAM